MQDEMNGMDPISGIETLKGVPSEQLAKAICRVLDAKKARDIRVLHLGNTSDLADFMILAGGTSRTHVQSLSGDVEYWLGQKGEHPVHTEGRNGGTWAVLDYGNVMVHIMSRETREFYNLENLYADVKSEKYVSESEEQA